MDIYSSFVYIYNRILYIRNSVIYVQKQKFGYPLADIVNSKGTIENASNSSARVNVTMKDRD